MENKTLIFGAEQVASKGAQILQTYGLNAMKVKFMQFDSVPLSDQPDKHSNLGTPIFDTITFYGNGNNGDISYYDPQLQKTVTVGKMTIDVALITVNQVVNVVRTKVAGSTGSVKQYITLDDYDVEIKLVLSSEISDTRPEQKIRQLLAITKSTCEVNVASNVLNLFGVTAVVFEGQQQFEQVESQRDLQKVSLHCLSETPFTIKVTQQGSTSSNKF